MESRKAAIIKVQMLPQDFFIVVRRSSDVRLLGFHAVNIYLRNGDAEQQFTARHAVVAVRMVGGNGTLVAPEDMHFGPVHLAAEFGGRQQPVHHSRGVASRQCDEELAVS